jgi:hypothetical protein
MVKLAVERENLGKVLPVTKRSECMAEQRTLASDEAASTAPKKAGLEGIVAATTAISNVHNL